MIARAARVSAVVLALAGVARAQAAPPPPTLRASDYSRYEHETIADAVFQLKTTRDDAPDGKTLEGIDIVALEVIEERDPAPRFLNVFHATTRQYIVDREILLRPGQPYNQVLVDESVRNLRGLSQLSLVVAVPTQGSAPDRVRLLVITKDVWSLRLNSNFAVSSGGLEQLILQPSEINFLGTHQAASAFFELDPLSFTLGLGYRVPRVAGTRTILTTSANVIVNRASGSLEGSYGQLLAYQPQYSALNEWAWSSLVSWDDEIVRHYVNAQEAGFDSKLTAAKDAIPWEYRARRYVAQESLTRSFGWAIKNDFSIGASVDVRSYHTPDLSAYDPVAVGDFVRRNVPSSDTRLGPFLQYHGYTSRFVRLLDFETLGLQEDFRLGHQIYVRAYPLTKALGSSRDVLGVYGAAMYSVPLFSDGFARAYVESITEAESSRLSDASIGTGIHLVTPRLGFGRFVYDGRLLSRYRNYLNSESFLGGNTRLRGYPTNFFVGSDVVTSNVEYRTRPFEILSCELGAAAFYDMGDAFDDFSQMSMKMSAGAGLRILFPQLDRYVLRGDIGFPIGPGATIPGVAPMSFFIAFQQAFGVPALTANALPSDPP